MENPAIGSGIQSRMYLTLVGTRDPPHCYTMLPSKVTTPRLGKTSLPLPSVPHGASVQVEAGLLLIQILASSDIMIPDAEVSIGNKDLPLPSGAPEISPVLESPQRQLVPAKLLISELLQSRLRMLAAMTCSRTTMSS